MTPEHHTIGSYRILKILGQGGMGIVYQGQHLKTGQLVALKTVRLPSQSHLQSIRREIQALLKIHHPGIIRVVDEGIADGMPWYAMEFLEGITLRQYWIQLLTRDRTAPFYGHTVSEIGEYNDPNWWTQTLAENVSSCPITRSIIKDRPGAGASPVDLAATILGSEGQALIRLSEQTLRATLTPLHRLCAPLAYLHGEGIVHRDLKPDNIIIKSDGTPVIVDFGLFTQFRGELSREALHVEAASVGTIRFMAPEQIRGELVDARADLYSLGCILYEFLTGISPFTGDSTSAVLNAHLTVTPIPPSDLVPGLPIELDLLINRLLAKEPRRRLGYAADVAAALAQFSLENRSTTWGPDPRSYLYRPGFTGREAQLSILREHLVKLQDDRGGLIVLTGESGVGKTRCAMEIGREAIMHDITVLTGECLEEGAQPLEAFRKPLQNLADRCRERGKIETDRLLGSRVKVLALYERALVNLPGHEAYPDPQDLPSDASRLRLFTYLIQTFEALTEDKPLLLILDDLQWADDLTLEFLIFLLRSGHLLNKQILFVGTVRPEEMKGKLRQIADHQDTIMVEINRLNETAVKVLIQEMLSLSLVPENFTASLALHSEGNPFFVAEYLRTAVDEQLLQRDIFGSWQLISQDDGALSNLDMERLPVPRSLLNLVARRLDGLSDAARTVIKAAAIIGRECPLILLQKVTTLPEIELLNTLHEILRRQVMEEIVPGVFRFVHDKLRQGAAETISEEDRCELHHIAAQAIELIFSDNLTEYQAALGYHWQKAGDNRKACFYYRKSAHQAMKNHALDEAERLYRQYLSLMEMPTTESITARIDLAEKVLYLQGRNQEAINEQIQARAESRQIESPQIEVIAMRALGTIYMETGRIKQAQDLYDQVLAASVELEDRLLQATVLTNMAVLRKQQGLFEEAQSLFEQVLLIQEEEVEDRPEKGIILLNLAGVHLHLGRLDHALQLSQQALTIHRQVGNRWLEGIDLGNISQIYLLQGQKDKARELLEQALVINREVGNRRDEGIVLGNLATVHAEQGLMDEARHFFSQALTITREVDHSRHVGFLLGCLASLEYLMSGNGEKALHYAQEGEHLLDQIGDKYLLAECLCKHAHIEIECGLNSRQLMEQAHILIHEIDAAPGSQLHKSLSNLERSIEAFEKGEHHLLFRGTLIECMPEGTRHWLVETGLLSKEQALLDHHSEIS
ncbi:tetratricopeptide repeat protein [candidate division CSSED10-310 bacterium]|uniref:Tetratricopeptide repeat protein n=1 Tax=candidate division CSSED10-310 bacterium TaxID=2855610 RepID=A0ABV6Z1D3_UNCC1